MIAVIGKNNELGFENHLLCRIPSDLEHFREKTLHKTVIMGRKTYQSIGRLLPDRNNVILSQNENLKLEGAQVFYDFDSLLQTYQSSKEEIMIIGGAQIYTLFLPYAQKLYITKIDQKFQADCYFPDFQDFAKILSSKIVMDQTYSLNFLELIR